MESDKKAIVRLYNWISKLFSAMRFEWKRKKKEKKTRTGMGTVTIIDESMHNWK